MHRGHCVADERAEAMTWYNQRKWTLQGRRSESCAQGTTVRKKEHAAMTLGDGSVVVTVYSYKGTADWLFTDKDLGSPLKRPAD